MIRLWLLAPLCVVGILWSGFLMGEDKKKEAEPVIVTARLPTYYSKLGLSQRQRAQILKVRAKYSTEIEELQQKIKDLKDQEKVDCEKLLTAAQKARLKELLLGAGRNKIGDDEDREAPNKIKEPVAKSKNKGADSKDKPAPVEIKK